MAISWLQFTFELCYRHAKYFLMLVASFSGLYCSFTHLHDYHMEISLAKILNNKKIVYCCMKICIVIGAMNSCKCKVMKLNNKNLLIYQTVLKVGLNGSYTSCSTISTTYQSLFTKGIICYFKFLQKLGCLKHKECWFWQWNAATNSVLFICTIQHNIILRH